MKGIVALSLMAAALVVPAKGAVPLPGQTWVSELATGFDPSSSPNVCHTDKVYANLQNYGYVASQASLGSSAITGHPSTGLKCGACMEIECLSGCCSATPGPIVAKIGEDCTPWSCESPGKTAVDVHIDTTTWNTITDGTCDTATIQRRLVECEYTTTMVLLNGPSNSGSFFQVAIQRVADIGQPVSVELSHDGSSGGGPGYVTCIYSSTNHYWECTAAPNQFRVPISVRLTGLNGTTFTRPQVITDYNNASKFDLGVAFNNTPTTMPTAMPTSSPFVSPTVSPTGNPTSAPSSGSSVVANVFAVLALIAAIFSH